MRLHIIRHADPNYENDTITEFGHLEAQALARRLQSEGVDQIYHSPMGRACDTMKYTSDLLGIQPVEELWTKELFTWQIEHAMLGRDRNVIWDLPGELIRPSASLTTTTNWSSVPYYQQSPFYDNFQELKRSSDIFLEKQGYRREGEKYRMTGPHKDVVAVFCHCGFGLAWLAHLLELPLPTVWASFWLAPSSITTILFEERSEEWAVPRCIRLSDTSHLYEAGLPISNRGLLANYD
jgi:broad specificity phosphatase PhoE